MDKDQLLLLKENLEKLRISMVDELVIVTNQISIIEKLLDINKQEQKYTYLYDKQPFVQDD